MHYHKFYNVKYIINPIGKSDKKCIDKEDNT